MTLVLPGTARAERFNAVGGVPAASSSMTLCGWFKLNGTGEGPIMAAIRADTARSGFFQQAGGSTVIRCSVNWETGNTTFLDSAGGWVFLAMTQSGTTLTFRALLEGSNAWDAEWTTTGVTFAPERISLGSDYNEDYANIRVRSFIAWDAALPSSVLLEQAYETSPVTSSALLPWNWMDGPDLAADLDDDSATDFDLIVTGSGATYSTDAPDLTPPDPPDPPGPTITLAGQITPVAVGLVSFVTAPSLTAGGAGLVMVLVLGTDGAPYEGISVALTSGTPAAVTVASSPLTTDANGNATFTINGVAAGSSVLTASADSGVATDTATISVASGVTFASLTIYEPISLAQGGSLEVPVLSGGTNGAPFPGVAVLFSSADPTCIVVDPTYVRATGADFIVESTANSQHIAHRSFAPAAGVAYELSCEAKADSGRYLWLALNWSGGGRVGFDLQTGTVIAGTLPASAGSMEYVQDGWYRCALRVTPTDSTSNTVVVGIDNDGDIASNVSYTGDGARRILATAVQLAYAGPEPIGYARTGSGTVGLPGYGWRVPGHGRAVLRAADGRAGLAMRRKQSGAWGMVPHNYVRNSTMQGAQIAPAGSGHGVAPTNWWADWVLLSAGIQRQIVGIGTEDGCPYIDVRAFGTSTSTSGINLPVEATTAIPAKPGQTWTGSLAIRLLSSSGATFSTMFTVWERAAGGASIGAYGLDVPSSALNAASVQDARVQWTRKLQSASVEYVTAGFRLAGDGSSYYDATFRLACPQIEFGDTMGPFVPTSSAAAFAPAIDWLGDGGVLPRRVNKVRNSSAVGSTNAWPTAWSIAEAGHGLTVDVTTGVTVGGYPGIELHITGTAATSSIRFAFDTATAIIANTGEIVTASLYTQLVDGSLSGTTPYLSIVERLAAGTFNASGSVATSIGSDASRVTYTRTLSGTSTERAVPELVLSHSIGKVYDLTIRVAVPQLEEGHFASPPILTTYTGLVSGPAVQGFVHGVRVEAAATNGVTNSMGLGAAAGVWPTGWAGADASGLTWSVLGSGWEDGLPYVEVRLSGTSNATSSATLQCETGSGIAAAVGQTWTKSMFVRVVSGDLSHFSLARLGWDERAAGWLASRLGPIVIQTGGTLGTARVAHTETTKHASTTSLRPYLTLTPISGRTIDIVLRVAVPQIEQSTDASSPILTSLAAATRAADIPTVDLAAMYNQPVGVMHVDSLTTRPVAGTSQYALALSNGTTSYQSILYRATDSEVYAETLASTTQGLCETNAVVRDGGDIIAAARWAENDFALSLNGAAVVSDTSGSSWTTDVGVVATLGNNASGSRPLNGYVRRFGVAAHYVSDAALPLLALRDAAHVLAHPWMAGASADELLAAMEDPTQIRARPHNLIPRSEELHDGWTLTGATISADGGRSPATTGADGIARFTLRGGRSGSTTLTASSGSITDTATGTVGAGLAPIWITTDLPYLAAGVPYATTVFASGVGVTYSLQWTPPEWIAINATTGALTGTPPSDASVSITVRALAATGHYADRTFTINPASGDAALLPRRLWIGPDGGGASWRKAR